MAAVSIATFVATTAAYNVTTSTPDDWALWNSGSGSGTTLAPSQRKSGGGSTISSISRISTGNITGMTPEERIAHIDAALDGMRHGWPFVAAEGEARIASLTEQLINKDDERTRGAIHELRRLMELPVTLFQEREALGAALADQAAAD